MNVVAVARRAMESELAQLVVQRDKYLLAARTSSRRDVAMRRLMTVERLAIQIESLQEALTVFDDRTAPIVVDPADSRRIGLGPITPPAL